jgi:hypothetical protein
MHMSHVRTYVCALSGLYLYFCAFFYSHGSCGWAAPRRRAPYFFEPDHPHPL